MIEKRNKLYSQLRKVFSVNLAYRITVLLIR